MEATAVSLARSVLDGVLSSAGSAVADEVARLLGVPREVEFIRNELEMMQSFLRVASARPDAAARNDTVRTWVKQVRDLAYDVEDCLFDFALYSTTAASSWSRWLPDSLAARHSIAQRIRDLKHSIEELNKRNLRYYVLADPRAVGVADADVVQLQLQQPLLPYHDVLSATELAFQEWEIIGRSSEKDKLIKELISGGDGSALAVVSVWGMGGMGKSSLVSMVRNDPELLDAYDCSAWVTVPHPLDNTDEFMRRLRKQLGLGAAAYDDNDDDIKEHLKEKRYLIIVDDLLKRDEWDQVRPKLFNFQNAKGSRVIVTTRRKDVALYCAGEVHDHVYELKPLGDKESRNLLCKKVYKTTKCSLPAALEEETKCILERCRGLPLAISTIGGLLANRPKTSMEWMKLHEHFGAELESDLRNITNVIVSSYDGLPYHLKSIFLYLCIFPQNCDIRCNRLLRRWMAEGYIAKNRDMPVEEVAERFYNELMNRSMIQPSKKKKKIIPSFGVGRSTIHSMLLQIILPKAIEENQLFLIEKQCNGVPQSKIRHLVVSRWNKDKKLENINLSYIRSLTVFGDCPVSLISPKMRLLRVLDLEDTTDVKNEDLRHIGNLYHLRYLSLRGKNISRLPSSLQNLRYLETLDIQGTKVTQLPRGIVKLEKLRYILAGVNFSKDLLQKVAQVETDNQKTTLMGNMAAFQCCNCSEISSRYQLSVKAPKGIEKLRNLHMLGAFNVGRGHGVARRLEHLTDLQRLGVTVTGLSEKGSQELCHSIGKLGRLQRLEVRSHSLEFLAKMDESATPKHLASLKLLGNLSLLPKWIASLNDLTKVRLLGTKLEQGQIDILGNLRSLAFLGLWEKSYIGESLCFCTSKFPKLKFLDIDGLQKIKMVMVQEPEVKFLNIDGQDKIEIKVQAMPELEQLWVQNCRALSDSVDALSGIPHLVNLNELVVKQCGEKEKLIETLQWQISQWQVSLHKKRPKFFIGKIILPASSQPNTSAAAG